MLMASWLCKTIGINLESLLGLYTPGTEHFKPYQIITHMFMHANFSHIFFNMLALWMFGRVLEQVWGGKRFLLYYLITGLGAAIIHTGVNYLSLWSLRADASTMLQTLNPGTFAAFINEHFPAYYDHIYQIFLNNWFNNPGSEMLAKQAVEYVRQLIDIQANIPTVGASGAVYGVLLAFGMLFPNTQLLLLFPPIPIKAKWMVIAYGALELYLGLMQPGSNVAHFAHLGGMIFGFFLIKHWQKRSDSFY